MSKALDYVIIIGIIAGVLMAALGSQTVRVIGLIVVLFGLAAVTTIIEFEKKK
jgi:uncharacterized membrane protein YoaK (UPF0700 family)